MNTEEILKKFKSKNKVSKERSKYLDGLLTRILIGIILILGSMIFINYKDKNKELYQKYIFTDSLAFHKFNKIYDKYMGKFVDESKTIPEDKVVFSETLSYKGIDKYLDGYKLEVGTSYLVPTLQSGIVVFNGDKDDYGKTLIIQGVDGVDIWYCGVDIHEISLYDYIESGSLLGESASDKITIVVVKDGEFLDFEKYLSEL